MSFSKLGPKTLTKQHDLGPMTDIYRERERETNRIFQVNEFEFYEVF